MTTFADLGLSPTILKALEKTTLKTPTPIQAQAIPHIMQGRDLMGLAQTGTGKTAAFGLPLLHRILDIGHPPGPKNVRALILAPTRQLIGQIKDKNVLAELELLRQQWSERYEEFANLEIVTQSPALCASLASCTTAG